MATFADKLKTLKAQEQEILGWNKDLSRRIKDAGGATPAHQIEAEKLQYQYQLWAARQDKEENKLTTKVQQDAQDNHQAFQAHQQDILGSVGRQGASGFITTAMALFSSVVLWARIRLHNIRYPDFKYGRRGSRTDRRRRANDYRKHLLKEPPIKPVVRPEIETFTSPNDYDQMKDKLSEAANYDGPNDNFKPGFNPFEPVRPNGTLGSGNHQPTHG